jgi:aldehyde:ferredoxin oxidoreductase
VTPDRMEIEKAIDLYYEMAGWDKDGVPTRGKLAELGLEWTWDRTGQG